MTRVLVVDDDPAIQRTLAIGLRARGYDVVPARDGRTAVDACEDDEPDVVLLDLGLPDLSGVEVLRKVRERSQVPVIVLSARHGSDDKVEALDVGADDYVTKPFGMDELLARIRAAGRRTGGERPPVQAGELCIDLTDRRVTRSGERVHLTPKEWALLEALVVADGRVVRQTDLLHAVWGPGYGDESHYLRTYVGTLRKKLEADASRPRHLVTEPGVGYRFETS